MAELLIKPLENLTTQDRPGHVYMIQESTGTGKIPTDYYKIGSTNDPQKRISDLRTGNPRNLNYIAQYYVKDKIAAERNAQEKLKNYLVQDNPEGGKEWYKVLANQLESFKQGFKTAVDQYKN